MPDPLPPDRADATDLAFQGELDDLLDEGDALCPRIVRIVQLAGTTVHIFEPVIPSCSPDLPPHRGYIWHAYELLDPFPIIPSRRDPDGTRVVGRHRGAGRLLASSTISIDDALVRARTALTAPKAPPR